MREELKLGRLVVSLIGLAALAAAYITGSLYFLAVAVIAFVGGLYLMRAGKPPKKQEKTQ